MNAKDRESVIAQIMLHLDEGEVLAQLAEECDELAHAALKLRRAMEKKNPTPVRVEEAEARVVLEFVDVLNAIDVLGITRRATVNQLRDIGDNKLERWLRRLEEGCEHEGY